LNWLIARGGQRMGLGDRGLTEEPGWGLGGGEGCMSICMIEIKM
jgi:hypothetical protein